MNRITYIIITGLLLALSACGESFDDVSHVQDGAIGYHDGLTIDPLVNRCDPDEGLVTNEDGVIVEGITQCAICRRMEDAFRTRASELGCEERYPLNGCPIDEGMADCMVGITDEFIDGTYYEIEDCDTLVLFAGQFENYGGFECGDSCTWSDPYANPVDSDVEQVDTLPIAGGYEHDACDPGTPYQDRGWEE
jgi:hypothetical protein